MGTLKDYSDKASNMLDKVGLANPVEILNEELGGETRAESKQRRANKTAAEQGGLEGKAPEKPAKMPKFAKGGSVSSASKRADGIAVKGKTRGKIV